MKMKLQDFKLLKFQILWMRVRSQIKLLEFASCATRIMFDITSVKYLKQVPSYTTEFVNPTGTMLN